MWVGFLCKQLLSLVYELAQSLKEVFFQVLVRQAELVIPGPPRTSLTPYPRLDSWRNQPMHIRVHTEMCQFMWTGFSCNCIFIAELTHTNHTTWELHENRMCDSSRVCAYSMFSHKSILPSCWNTFWQLIYSLRSALSSELILCPYVESFYRLQHHHHHCKTETSL